MLEQLTEHLDKRKLRRGWRKLVDFLYAVYFHLSDFYSATVRVIFSGTSESPSYAQRIATALERIVEKTPDKLLSSCQFSVIVISIVMLYFSLTAFVGLSFYADMTNQNAFTAMVNHTSGSDGAEIRFGASENYNSSCDFSREIASQDVPCGVLASGTSSVLAYLEAQTSAERSYLVDRVSAGAYRKSRLASTHYDAMTFMPVAVAVAALSALLISLTTNTFVNTLRGVEVAVLSSGVALLALKPLIIRYISAVALGPSASPSEIVVLASELGSIPPFTPHLVDLTRWAVGMTAVGAFMLALSYSDIGKGFNR